MFNQSFSLTKYTRLLIIAGLFVSPIIYSVEQVKPVAPLNPQDFAYGMPLYFSGQDAVYQTILPINIYQGTTRSDLGDLRVFNAQGEVVPHMLRQLAHNNTSTPSLKTLPFFPLQGSAESNLDQLSVKIKRNTAGTLIDIGSSNKPTTTTKISGYLLDASSIKLPIQALELDWPTGKESFVGSIQIETSDDLKHWSMIVRNAPLANLQFGGHSLLQKRVEFPALHAKYIRLSWPAEQAALRLASASAELSGTLTETPLTWLNVSANEVKDSPGEYQFDLGAHLPVQRLRIELPQMNTLVQAALFSKARPDDSWHSASNAVLYKLHNSGQDLKNPDIAITTSNDRYWLLRVDQKGGGLGSGLPQMQVGWQPQQLLFVTRGNPPFQLAYGSIEIKPAEFQLQNLLASNGNSAELKIQSAQTGQPINLAGETKLNPPPLPYPWKKWILWAVLSVSVLLLGWMAYRLVKQMESHDSKNSPANKI